MAAEENPERRPQWVRLVMRESMKRSAALPLAGLFVLLTCLGLLAVAIELGSSSFLGALALPVGLTGACICAAGAVWSWLAIRWVDRNGKWPDLPNQGGTGHGN